MVFPVAPPRLAGASDGFVDTLHSVSDIDLHGGVFSGWFNPHAAVPSMHFGYALMIGLVGMVLLRSWPLRLIALAYPVLVFLTITGTANHYVLDSLAGGVVVALGFAGVYLWMAARGTFRQRRRRPGRRRHPPARPSVAPSPVRGGRPTRSGDDVRTERIPSLTVDGFRSISRGAWRREPPAPRPSSPVRQ